MQKKKLTVIVLAYNQEKYLSQCIDSILSQKVSFDFQILIGNDGSSDNTAFIAQNYEKKYPDRIKFYFTERSYRKYVGDYINFGNLHKKTKTDYFCVLDGDDFYIDENKLQIQVDFLEKNNSYTFVGHNYNYLYSDGKIIAAYSDNEVLKYKNTCENLSQFLVGGITPFMQTSTLMFRNIFKNDKTFHGYFKSKMAHMYHSEVIRTALHASQGKGYYINKLMSVYRIHNEGFWSKKNIIDQALTMIHFYRFHSKYTFSKKYTKEFNQLIIKELKKLFTFFRR
jgi:glycosyltransferase involved in cell wall biosynthesis